MSSTASLPKKTPFLGQTQTFDLLEGKYSTGTDHPLCNIAGKSSLGKKTPKLLSFFLICISSLFLIADIFTKYNTLVYNTVASKGERILAVKHAEVSGDSASVTTANMAFGCVIDAGSSGTRIYVYKWPKRVFKQLSIPLTSVYKTPVLNYNRNGKNGKTPGISTFVDNPSAAGQARM
jgi:hypothetical protein